MKELLISPNDVKFKRTSSTRGYASMSGLFIVRKDVFEKQKWVWMLTTECAQKYPHLRSLEKLQAGHSSWMKARDEIITLLQKYNTKVNNKMVVNQQPSYCCLLQDQYTPIRIWKDNKRWKLENFLNNELTTKLVLNIEQTTSRKQIIEQIHRFVAENLSYLYENQKALYLQERELLLNHQISDNNHINMSFCLWWMAFIPLEVDLSKIFDAN